MELMITVNFLAFLVTVMFIVHSDRSKDTAFEALSTVKEVFQAIIEIFKRK